MKQNIQFGRNKGNPCWDTKTKTDCPNRKLGCRTDCAAWIEYNEEAEKVRNEPNEAAEVVKYYMSKKRKEI